MSTAFVLLPQRAVLAHAFVCGVLLAIPDFMTRTLAMTSGHGGVGSAWSVLPSWTDAAVFRRCDELQKAL